MLAYVHVLRQLEEWPDCNQSLKAWDALDKNYEAHVMEPKSADAIYVICSRLILKAWEVREKTWKHRGESLEMPRIESETREKAMQMRSSVSSEQLNVVGSRLRQPSIPFQIDGSCLGFSL